MPRVYLSLGSNQGNSSDLLKQASSDLGAGFSEFRVSSVYKTRPQVVLNQPDFLNLAIEGDTSLTWEEFLDFSQAIEAKWGRVRIPESPKGPRTLDIDIVLWSDRLIQAPRFRVPHPGINDRAFYLIPLLELNPELLLPGTEQKLSAILEALPDQGVYLQGETLV